MVIGVDCDGVLCDFNSAFISRCIVVTGKDLFGPGFVPTTWDYPTRQAGYTREETRAVWDSIKADEKFWQNLSGYETTLDDISYLRHLEEKGHDVYFITNRMGTKARLQTIRWLRRKGFQDPMVILTQFKGLAARVLQLEFYIDDKWENCIDVASLERTDIHSENHSFKQVDTYIFDRPWNRDRTGIEDTEADLFRVHSVKAALQETFILT